MRGSRIVHWLTQESILKIVCARIQTKNHGSSFAHECDIPKSRLKFPFALKEHSQSALKPVRHHEEVPLRGRGVFLLINRNGKICATSFEPQNSES